MACAALWALLLCSFALCGFIHDLRFRLSNSLIWCWAAFVIGAAPLVVLLALP